MRLRRHSPLTGSREELFLAYRQAKNTLFFERNLGLVDLARAQRQLPPLLRRVEVLFGRGQAWFRDVPLGKTWIVPKKAKFPEEPAPVTTVADDAPPRTEALHVRVQLQPSIEFSVIEILWLWEFGAVLETQLGPHAHANRLKLAPGSRAVDRLAATPFRYWPREYSRFRSGGLNAARDALSQSRRCLLASLDLAGYYDEIDPSFLLSGDFCRQLEKRAVAQGIPFRLEAYVQATQTLLDAYNRFRVNRAKLTGITSPRGVPIGCITAKVVSNLALAHLDALVSQHADVRYYGRYVDDILLVASPAPTGRNTLHEVLSKYFPLRSNPLRLNEVALERPGSRFIVQDEKVRVHTLRGRAGHHFLAAVATSFLRTMSLCCSTAYPSSESLRERP